MPTLDDEFYRRLLETFKVEADDHLGLITSGLIDYEKAPAEKRTGLIETIYREVHSLKGSAGAVNASDIRDICQSLEGVFALLKRKEIAMSPPLLDLLHGAVDTTSQLLHQRPGLAALESSRINEIIQNLARVNSETAPASVTAPAAAEAAAEAQAADTVVRQNTPPRPQEPHVKDTVRISTAKLKSLLLQAEELLAAKLAVAQHTAELRDVFPGFSAWEKECSKIRPDVRIAQQYLEKNKGATTGEETDPRIARILRFAEWNLNYMKSLGFRLRTMKKSAEIDQRSIAGMVNSLLEEIKKTLMLPFSSLLVVFPKLVRDLGRELGKEADLVIQGEDIELDKRILDELKNPLVHLLRNCLDHGLEKPDVRESRNKPRRGRITITVSQKDRQTVEIAVADDGSGIDAGKVKLSAVKQGVLTRQQVDALADQELTALIFHSGISTSPLITDVSGRGLGLAIVREKVEQFGGTVSVAAVPGAGTTFRLLLPAALATFRGIVVEEYGHSFIFPTTSVARVARLRPADIKTGENREMIKLDGHAVALVRLGDVLEIQRQTPADENPDSIMAVILGSGQNLVAFGVDKILNEQEVLVRNLSANLSRVRNIASATVFGTGQIVPVLNVSDLMKSAGKATPSRLRTPAEAADTTGRQKSILVVEDSVTARTLLVNIIEAAGYEVRIAVNGMDALIKLMDRHFDLVVSDVDMPEMGGFDLTARIRSDKRLAALPVILVTALDSREDRERGVEVGADAYIVKGSFDQSNLLEIIGRLA